MYKRGKCTMQSSGKHQWLLLGGKGRLLLSAANTVQDSMTNSMCTCMVTQNNFE